MFSPELAEKPFIVAYNKMDLPEAFEKWESFKEKLLSIGIEPFCISAINREGTRELINAAYELVRQGIEDSKDESKLSLLATCFSVLYGLYNVKTQNENEHVQK